jgi:phosphate transport system protein
MFTPSSIMFIRLRPVGARHKPRRRMAAILAAVPHAQGGMFPVSDFQSKLDQLMKELVAQGDRVADVVLRAVESYFDLDAAKARGVIDGDGMVDKVDVQIERASVPLLAMGRTDPREIRSVLMIVKINNELERIADCAVNIAEVVQGYADRKEKVPRTFRVMANSVIGMLRDANRSLARLDPAIAEQVLDSDDTVDRFKHEIILDAQEKVAAGEFSAQFAFRLHTVTKSLERIADHCTNICEQVIYLQSGRIVRHMAEGWTEPALPEP